MAKEKDCKNKILKKLTSLRKSAYAKEGSYEDSYAYLMNGVDKIIDSCNKN